MLCRQCGLRTHGPAGHLVPLETRSQQTLAPPSESGALGRRRRARAPCPAELPPRARSPARRSARTPRRDLARPRARRRASAPSRHRSRHRSRRSGRARRGATRPHAPHGQPQQPGPACARGRAQQHMRRRGLHADRHACEPRVTQHPERLQRRRTPGWPRSSPRRPPPARPSPAPRPAAAPDAAAPSSVGVPPPKKTVVRRPPAQRVRASRSSASAASTNPSC